jgi:hypothetical protein
VTLIDGLVLARSAFHHSMNYRSVIFGRARLIEDEQEKIDALRAQNILSRAVGMTCGPNERELQQTTVLSLPLTEASAKIRTGPPLMTKRITNSMFGPARSRFVRVRTANQRSQAQRWCRRHPTRLNTADSRQLAYFLSP